MLENGLVLLAEGVLDWSLIAAPLVIGVLAPLQEKIFADLIKNSNEEQRYNALQGYNLKLLATDGIAIGIAAAAYYRSGEGSGFQAIAGFTLGKTLGNFVNVIGLRFGTPNSTASQVIENQPEYQSSIVVAPTTPRAANSEVEAFTSA
jgi:hypothetical protein